MLCSAQLVRNANDPKSAAANTLNVFRFGIDHRMNTFIWPCNSKRADATAGHAVPRYLAFAHRAHNYSSSSFCWRALLPLVAFKPASSPTSPHEPHAALHIIQGWGRRRSSGWERAIFRPVAGCFVRSRRDLRLFLLFPPVGGPGWSSGLPSHPLNGRPTPREVCVEGSIRSANRRILADKRQTSRYVRGDFKP